MIGVTLFPAEKLRKYPHLMVSDVEIWERYLDLYAKQWDSFAYDVRCGEGVPQSKTGKEGIGQKADTLWEKRIDVVGLRGSELFIIEVKPAAMLSAIGQLLSYEVLFKERYPDEPDPKLMLITNWAGPDLKSLCSKFKIALVVV